MITSRSQNSVIKTQFPVQCISIGRTAPRDLRERASVAVSDTAGALADARKNTGLKRLVILSTCHRTEIYAQAEGNARNLRNEILGWLANYRELDTAELESSVTSMYGSNAIRHLFRVALGLDSTLIGESEIIGQVRGALQQSISVHAASPMLKAIFKEATETAEYARKNLWVQFKKADIGTAAVDAVGELLGVFAKVDAGSETHGALAGRHVAVVGAGSSSRLAVRALYYSGARITIFNRTIERAITLAARYGCETGELESLSSVMAGADAVDAVIVGTSAPQPVVTAECLERAAVMNVEEPGHSRAAPMVIVDMSSPRNVDPAAGGYDWVTLRDLQYLDSRIASANSERASAIPDAETIIESRIAMLARRNWGSFQRPVVEGFPRPQVAR